MQPEVPQRLADLWWLLAHDERGTPRLGRGHLALGLSAAVLGELLTQPSALVTNGCLTADPVIAHPLGDMVEAVAQGIHKPMRPWVEWLAMEHHNRTTDDVVARLTGAGFLVRRGRYLAPVTALTSFAPIGALITALGAADVVLEPVRLLAGLACCCGLAPLVATGGEDVTWPLQRLAMGLPKPLHALVVGLDDAVNTLAMRRR